jgi:hypothetical protein
MNHRNRLVTKDLIYFREVNGTRQRKGIATMRNIGIRFFFMWHLISSNRIVYLASSFRGSFHINNYYHGRLELFSRHSASTNRKNLYKCNDLRKKSVLKLQMTLIRLQVQDIEQLISVNGKPTAQQYQSYFGRTEAERYSRIVEGCIVALVGCCMSYFLSFVFGGFVATILGTLSLLWGILSPELKAWCTMG